MLGIGGGNGTGIAIGITIGAGAIAAPTNTVLPGITGTAVSAAAGRIECGPQVVEVVEHPLFPREPHPFDPGPQSGLVVCAVAENGCPVWRVLDDPHLLPARGRSQRVLPASHHPPRRVCPRVPVAKAVVVA